MMNLLRDDEALFSAPLTFPNRYTADPEYFTDEHDETFDYWGPELNVHFANFIPDLDRIELIPWPRAKGSRGAFLEIAGGVLAAHVIEMAGGVLTKIHRHGPGAHVLWLDGAGYSRLGQSMEDMIREDWGPGTLLVPPSGWWHNHAVVTSHPARHIALKIGGRRNSIHRLNHGSMLSTRMGGSQLEFDDVPESVRRGLWEEFAASCRAQGTTPQMEEITE
jgi:hypothetical protein